MDDDFGDDADYSAAFEAAERTRASNPPPARQANGASTASASSNASNVQPRVQQPKPQALLSRAGASSILVSPRQKGNPILNSIRAMPWEYSDIPADYVLGATTCALFLSLKYHRLHPEYIYSRIRALAGKYNLRILLTMVDIPNHEESLKELSKTSLINNVTVILCWSAQEAGRYLELFKTYEHAAPTSIRAHQSTNYSDKLVEFITVPRSINKTDAVGLVSNFGSIRTAINARPEEVGLIAGWGEKKVQRWCSVVREPFRIKKAARRSLPSKETPRAEGESDSRAAARLGVGAPIGVAEELDAPAAVTQPGPDPERRAETRAAEDVPTWEPGEDEEEVMREAEAQQSAAASSVLVKTSHSGVDPRKRKAAEEDNLSEGMMAALAKLRQAG